MINYRITNRHIARPQWPMMSMDEIKGKILPSWHYFFSLDLTSGYYQVLLDDSSKYITSFIVPQGRFRFNVLPMGLKPSCNFFNPATQILEQQEHRDNIKIVDDVGGGGRNGFWRAEKGGPIT